MTEVAILVICLIFFTIVISIIVHHAQKKQEVEEEQEELDYSKLTITGEKVEIRKELEGCAFTVKGICKHATIPCNGCWYYENWEKCNLKKSNRIEKL